MSIKITTKGNQVTLHIEGETYISRLEYAYRIRTAFLIKRAKIIYIMEEMDRKISTNEMELQISKIVEEELRSPLLNEVLDEEGKVLLKESILAWLRRSLVRRIRLRRLISKLQEELFIERLLIRI